MQTRDLERIRFVTRYYKELQGLQLVASGLMLLGFALTEARWQGILGFLLAVALTLALLGVSIGLQVFSASYYTRTFGKALKRGARKALQPKEPLAVGIMVAVLLLVLLLVGLLAWNPGGVSAFMDHSFWRILCLLLGGVLVGTWISRGCRPFQFHRLALGVLLLSLATARRLTLFVPPFSTLGSALLLCGLAATLTGLLDHWQLLRTLGPPSAAFLAEEDAAPVEAQR